MKNIEHSLLVFMAYIGEFAISSLSNGHQQAATECCYQQYNKGIHEKEKILRHIDLTADIV